MIHEGASYNVGLRSWQRAACGETSLTQLDKAVGTIPAGGNRHPQFAELENVPERGVQTAFAANLDFLKSSFADGERA